MALSLKLIPIDLPVSADGGVMFVTRMKFSSLDCKAKILTLLPDIATGSFLATVAPGSS